MSGSPAWSFHEVTVTLRASIVLPSAVIDCTSVRAFEERLRMRSVSVSPPADEPCSASVAPGSTTMSALSSHVVPLTLVIGAPGQAAAIEAGV